MMTNATEKKAIKTDSFDVVEYDDGSVHQLDAAALEVAVRGLTEGRRERPDEVRLRHARHRRQRRHVERLAEVAIHGVARSQHPAMQILHPAHDRHLTTPIGQFRRSVRHRSRARIPSMPTPSRPTVTDRHAARTAIERGFDDVLVVYGDHPLLEPDELAAARRRLVDGPAVVVLGFRPPDPAAYGRLIEKDGKLIAIREAKDCSAEELRIGFCNSGLTAIDGRKTTQAGYAAALKVVSAPTLVLFDPGGREILRLEAYFRPFHVAGALEYVSSGAWRREPSFQRFLQARAERMRARGQPVDLWN